MAKYKRRAEWVWRQRELFGLNTRMQREDIQARMRTSFSDEANRFVYLRKTFELTGDVAKATVDVSADGRYQLFVNGKWVGRGPARCSAAWQKYDTYEIASHLKPGRNVVAALVRSYGRDTGWYELPKWEQSVAFGCGSFFLQGSVMTRSGDEVLLDTNDTWRYLVSQAWKRDTVSGQLGFAEEYDARQAPKGWQELAFDDSAWEAAQVLRVEGRWGSNDVVPFPVMIPRDIPVLLEEIHWPEAIVSYGEVENARDAASVADGIHKEAFQPLKHCRARNLEAILRPEGEAEIVTAEGRSVSLVLDFGKTEAGRVRLEVQGPAGAIIDFCYTERVQQDGRVEPTVWGPRHVYAHRVVLSEEPLTWEMFDWGGFRYLQVTFRNCPQPLRVKAINVNFTSYPVGNRGQFVCNDELLNKAYTISAYTLQCCMHDSYEDCPSREQRQWTNDQYVHLMANYGVFGDPHLARNLLVQVAQSQQEDGQVMQCAPGDLAVTKTFNMPEFTLHWIMSIPQYVRYSGDTEIIRQLYPTVVKGLEWFERHLDEDDLLNDVPGILWIDWAEVDKKGQMTELNARFVGCLRIAAEMAKRLDNQYDAQRLGQLAERIASSLRQQLWDERRGVYVDTRRRGVQSRRVSQESSTAAMFFGVAPREQWERMLSYITDETRLVHTAISVDHRGYHGEPGFDEETQVVLQHAFYMHFIHNIWAQLGRGSDILHNIRRLWGPQVQAGTKTWWEGWEMGTHPTLCHAFSCTPGFDLATYILGVSPLSDGFASFRVAPLPADLEWVRGTFPTVKGDIPVSWRWQGQEWALSVTVPQGCEAELVLPEVAGKTLRKATLDGQAAKGRTQTVRPGEHELVGRYE